MLPITPPTDTHQVTEVDVASEEGYLEVTQQRPTAAFVVVFGIMLILAVIAIAVSMSTGGSPDPAVPQDTGPFSAPFWVPIS